MNATPKTMARNIRAARTQRAQVVPATILRLAFTSETGVIRPERKEVAPVGMDEHEPHCFVCGRHTDHFAEHDDMVEAGTARYPQDAEGNYTGDVYPVPWMI